MIRLKNFAVALLIAAMATASIAAQAPRGGPGRGRGAGGGPLGGIPLASLNLTQGQQDQIMDIRERSRQEMQALHDRTLSQILAVLTPEQQAEVKKLQADQQQRREQRRGNQQQ